MTKIDIDTVMRIIAIIPGLIIMYLWMALTISWSNMDYCKHGISPQTTCRETYTIWNWW